MVLPPLSPVGLKTQQKHSSWHWSLVMAASFDPHCQFSWYVHCLLMFLNCGGISGLRKKFE